MFKPQVEQLETRDCPSGPPVPHPGPLVPPLWTNSAVIQPINGVLNWTAPTASVLRSYGTVIYPDGSFLVDFKIYGTPTIWGGVYQYSGPVGGTGYTDWHMHIMPGATYHGIDDGHGARFEVHGFALDSGKVIGNATQFAIVSVSW